MKNIILKFLHRHPMVPVYCGLVWNMIFVTLNGILGLLYTSRWFLAMAVYHVFLAFMRLAVVNHEKSSMRNDKSILRSIGIALMVLGVILAAVVSWTSEEHRGHSYPPVLLVLMALATFAYAGWAIHNAQAARKEKSLLRISLRNISAASAGGALLSLERAVFRTFWDISSEGAIAVEMLSGVVVFVGIMILSVRMIKRGKI